MNKATIDTLKLYLASLDKSIKETRELIKSGEHAPHAGMHLLGKYEGKKQLIEQILTEDFEKWLS